MTSELAPRRLIKLDEDYVDHDIEMEVYLELEVDGLEYALLVPLDLPVEIYAQAEEDGMDVLLPLDPSQLGPLAKHVTDALKPWGVVAKVRDGEMVLVGDPPDEFFEDCEGIEVDTDEGPEEFAVLVQLETGEETLLVTTPIVPELMPVRLDAGRARPLSDAELADLEETFRAALMQFADEDAEEKSR